jgi:hypothetical protein
MGDPVKANIIKSKAVLWYAPEGESLPDETTIGAGVAWGGNWARLGYTNAPLTLLYEDERMAIEVQELLAELDEWRTKEAGSLETVLSELTADYLSLLTDGTPSTTAAGASQVGYEELDIGGEGRVEVYAVGIEGIRYDSSDNALPIRFFAPRATFKKNGNLEFSQRTDTYVNVPIMIKALGDPDNSGRLFKTQRVTAPATS